MTQARVLHVFKKFRPTFTGEGIFLERLAPRFVMLRPDIEHDVAVTDVPEPASLSVPKGLGTVHYLARGASPLGQLEFLRWMTEHIDEYAVVHFHTHVDRAFAASLALKLRGRRIILSSTLDDSVPGLLRTYRPALRPVVRQLFRLVDQFVAISARLYDENNLLIPQGKSSLIPIGIPIPQNAPQSRSQLRTLLNLPADATILVCVGDICRRKDQLFLVEQLPTLVADHPSLLLLLVGPSTDADYRSALDACISRHGLQNHVAMIGYSDAPYTFYCAADLMVFASRSEGFGTAVIEAMAHGLAVVARRLPGVNDTFIENGRSGLLFDAASDFQRCVRTLLDDPGLRKEIGATGRHYVASHFDITSIAGEYLKLYQASTEGVAQ